MQENETPKKDTLNQKEKIRARYQGINPDELDIIPATPQENFFEDYSEKRVAIGRINAYTAYTARSSKMKGSRGSISWKRLLLAERGGNDMAEHDIYILKIDDEFQHLIPPLSPEERKQLEENILSDGCREPLCVWNKTILDGHNRYEICTRHQIPFKISYIFLRSREEAVAWICANQLGRRNITEEARRYLIGKRYEVEKIIGAHNAAGTNQYTRKEVRAKMLPEPVFDDTACRTKERLGKEYRISHATVAKYGDYTKAVDSLSKVDPELVPKILSGQIKISHKNIVGLSNLPTSDIRRVSECLAEESAGFVGFSGTRHIVPQKGRDQQSPPLIPVGSVKIMPVYDPDAEILSLALTVPSWVSSIDRTRAAANFIEISGNARRRIEEELCALRSSVEAMLLEIKEEI